MEIEQEVLNEKSIGNYKIKFKTLFNGKKSDYIILNMSVSEDLKKLLKDAIIEEEIKEIIKGYDLNNFREITQKFLKEIEVL